ncbi:hypothetical protein CC78DRAFT_578888 [Lojkania enalia]|uniref:Uncharacterized protein n=1 Tax=Lojkania enalia TaxID=147567 RepID=A0A9P4N565_9PLEO|nr:hypothetical protein CC78DRAFT_578888 [Didymosphaeria enalia]
MDVPAERAGQDVKSALEQMSGRPILGQVPLTPSRAGDGEQISPSWSDSDSRFAMVMIGAKNTVKGQGRKEERPLAQRSSARSPPVAQSEAAAQTSPGTLTWPGRDLSFWTSGPIWHPDTVLTAGDEPRALILWRTLITCITERDNGRHYHAHALEKSLT